MSRVARRLSLPDFLLILLLSPVSIQLIHFLLRLSQRTLAERNMPAVILTRASVEGARSLRGRGSPATPLPPTKWWSGVLRCCWDPNFPSREGHGHPCGQLDQDRAVWGLLMSRLRTTEPQETRAFKPRLSSQARSCGRGRRSCWGTGGGVCI